MSWRRGRDTMKNCERCGAVILIVKNSQGNWQAVDPREELNGQGNVVLSTDPANPNGGRIAHTLTRADRELAAARKQSHYTTTDHHATCGKRRQADLLAHL